MKKNKYADQRAKLLDRYQTLCDLDPRAEDYDAEQIEHEIGRVEKELDRLEERHQWRVIDPFDEDEIQRSLRWVSQRPPAESDEEEDPPPGNDEIGPLQKEIDNRDRFKDFDNLFSQNFSEPYAQFPLLLLGSEPFRRASGRPTGDDSEKKETLLEKLIWYSVCHVASHIMRQDGNEQPHLMTKNPPTGFNGNKANHRAVATAMRRLEVLGGDIKTIGRIRRECQVFLENFADERPVLVRLPMRTLFSFWDHPHLNELDFRVLAAVNSFIGDKSHAVISAEQIAVRSVGAKNRVTLKKLTLTPPSRWQVGRSLAKLQESGYIHRVLLDRRTTFVCRANSMSADDLEAIARNSKAQRHHKGKARLVIS